MPNPCYYQNYDRSILYPAQTGSGGFSLKMCADEINDEEEEEVWWVPEFDRLISLDSIDIDYIDISEKSRVGEPIQLFSSKTKNYGSGLYLYKPIISLRVDSE